MKKKLEADLISIAHRILKLKNKSDINQLCLETEKLYEKLVVLKFIDEHFDSQKPTIGRNEIESQIETIFEEEQKTVIETKIEDLAVEEILAPVKDKTEKIAEEEKKTECFLKSTEDPVFEDSKEKTIEEGTLTTAKPVQISFEDIIGVNYADAHFVKVDNFDPINVVPSTNEFEEKTIIENDVLEKSESKETTLNAKLAKSFHIDLNDRIAFTKNLFGSNSEDYSRVLNQLLTFDTYGEAQEFIENIVKLDYNNWEGKDDYAERFLKIIENRFL